MMQQPQGRGFQPEGHGLQQEGRGFQAVVDFLRRKYGWRLDHEIGQGGFGVVYREVVDGVERAVKISRFSLEEMGASPGNANDVQAAVQRELEAIELLCRVGNHPHVLTLIRYEVVLGHLVTVWELASEGTLLDRLKEHQRQNGQCGLPLDQLMPWMEQAAEGIEFLNSRGIFHRDIKPQNLFLVGGQVKVGDLGFLKLAGLSTASQTGMGTVGYLPLEAYPRSANEKGQLHRTIDVYGLAATYVHLRTGKPPFGTTPHEITARQQRGDPCTEGMTAAEAEWVRQALSPRPNDRPTSAKSFVQQLESRLMLGQMTARPAVVAQVPELPSLDAVQVGPVQPREHRPTLLPPVPEDLARLQGQFLALTEAIEAGGSGIASRPATGSCCPGASRTSIPARESGTGQAALAAGRESGAGAATLPGIAEGRVVAAECVSALLSGNWPVGVFPVAVAGEERGGQCGGHRTQAGRSAKTMVGEEAAITGQVAKSAAAGLAAAGASATRGFAGVLVACATRHGIGA
jgi:serine/threonine protein kinase